MTVSLDNPRSPNEIVKKLRNERLPRQTSGLLLGLLLVAALSFGGWRLYGSMTTRQDGTTSSVGLGTLTYTLVRSRLLITVVDDGNVESSRNIEVKCQVAGGSSILSIVPDGKEVEVGETLVRLDQSSIEDQLNTQAISLGKAEASKIQAEENFAAAELGVKEYAKGTYVKEMQIAEANINIAQENLRSSENLLKHTRKMARKGYVNSLQVEADEFSVERSKLELESAKTAKEVLQEFTRQKMLRELEAKREAAAALKSSEQAAFKLEQARRERLEKQLGNCTIKAPQSGMVIYANEPGSSRRGTASVKIEEGAAVRESQTILRLPDLNSMQVRMTVHETNVDKLKVGMPASIRITDRAFQGTIVTIANQPEPGSWTQSNIKEYATVVKIGGESEGLKPGMTAEVEVLVADLPDVLAVPVTCVVEQGGKHYSWVVVQGNKYERRPVILGMTNEKLIEIKDGLKEGDVVLMNPRAIVDEARNEKPKLTPEAVDPTTKFGGAALKTEPNGSKNGTNGEKVSP